MGCSLTSGTDYGRPSPVGPTCPFPGGENIGNGDFNWFGLSVQGITHQLNLQGLTGTHSAFDSSNESCYTWRRMQKGGEDNRYARPEGV